MGQWSAQLGYPPRPGGPWLDQLAPIGDLGRCPGLRRYAGPPRRKESWGFVTYFLGWNNFLGVTSLLICGFSQKIWVPWTHDLWAEKYFEKHGFDRNKMQITHDAWFMNIRNMMRKTQTWQEPIPLWNVAFAWIKHLVLHAVVALKLHESKMWRCRDCAALEFSILKIAAF